MCLWDYLRFSGAVLWSNTVNHFWVRYASFCSVSSAQVARFYRFPFINLSQCRELPETQLIWAARTSNRAPHVVISRDSQIMAPGPEYEHWQESSSDGPVRFVLIVKIGISSLSCDIFWSVIGLVNKL
jgi:hypothetical protein